MTEGAVIHFSYALITSLLWSACFILVLLVVRRVPRLRIHNSMELMLAVALVCAFRPLLIYEPPFSIEISLPTVYPQIIDFFRMKLFAIGNHSVNVFALFLVVWIVGAAIMLFAYSRSRAKYRHWLSAINNLNNDRISEALHQIVSKTKPGAKYKLIVSPQIQSPALYGIINPTVLMPDIEFDSTELDIILSHEWNHYLRKDNLIRTAIYSIRCLFWWNPLTHMLCREICEIQEEICDITAIRNMQERERNEYIMACACATQKILSSKNKHCVASHFADSGASQLRRMESLVSYSKKTNRIFVTLFSLLFVVTLAASYVFILQAAFQSPQFENEIVLDESSAFLVALDDGSYAWYQDSELVGTISKEAITIEPFSQFPIYGNEGALP